MSRLETPATRWYWNQLGGTLVEEFPLAKRTASSSERRADGLIVLGGEHRIAHKDEVELRGRDVVVVQTKVGRVGMYLLGQAVFSLLLVERNYDVASSRSVALCERDDDVLHELLGGFERVEIVVAPSHLFQG